MSVGTFFEIIDYIKVSKVEYHALVKKFKCQYNLWQLKTNKTYKNNKRLDKSLHMLLFW